MGRAGLQLVIGACAAIGGCGDDGPGSEHPQGGSGGASSGAAGTTAAETYDGATWAARCAAMTTEDECAAVPSGHYPDEGITAAWCSWATWVEVELDGDACVFGAVHGSCSAQSASTMGCFSLGTCERGGWIGARRTNDAGVVELGRETGSCFPLPGDACDTQQEAPEICDCLCDPAWPGVPG